MAHRAECIGGTAWALAGGKAKWEQKQSPILCVQKDGQ